MAWYYSFKHDSSTDESGRFGSWSKQVEPYPFSLSIVFIPMTSNEGRTEIFAFPSQYYWASPLSSGPLILLEMQMMMVTDTFDIALNEHIFFLAIWSSISTDC